MVERFTPNWRARSVSEGSGSPVRSESSDDALLDELAICR
jgi:hypothetical protein